MATETNQNQNNPSVDVNIKNYTQDDVAYKSVPKIWLRTAESTDDNPVLVPFTYGESVSKTVDLDFSSGNMSVEIAERELVTEMTIKQPENLLPENIRSGETVAGIEGAFIGDTEEVTVYLAMADGDQVITPSAEGKVLSQVTITKPETLVPENIVSGVDIGGVVGNVSAPESEEANVTLDFSSGDMEISPDEGKTFSKVNIPKPETLLAENIAEGVDIAGIIGTLVSGGGGNVVSSFKSFKPTSTTSVTVEHGLGVIPDIVIVYRASTSMSTKKMYLYLGASSKALNAGIKFPGTLAAYLYSTSSNSYYDSDTGCIDRTGSYPLTDANESTITVNSYSAGYLDTSATYRMWCIGGLV